MDNFYSAVIELSGIKDLWKAPNRETLTLVLVGTVLRMEVTHRKTGAVGPAG